jgi:PRC-barrel domain
LSRAAEDRGPISRIEAPERCVGYEVYDPLGQKIGRVEKIFVNENHEPGYVRIRMGLFGMKSVLIPTKFVALDEERRALVLK